ncbi:MAG: type II toxin-antitoxin system HicB family antitoxin [Rhodospirillaceae bacterium]|nr:type II toxin-antitoxin system HicB family antitoxin [Rhodospirillaceae bacterium]
MPESYSYPAEVTLDENGRHVVSFPDFGWGTTDGATFDEALAKARVLLRELIACTMREARDLPEPSEPSGRHILVVPPVQTALKAALYEKFRRSGLSRRGLALKLGVAESEVQRMLNPDHATRAAAIDRALRRLG